MGRLFRRAKFVALSGPVVHPIAFVFASVAVVFALYNFTFWKIWCDVFSGVTVFGIVFGLSLFLMCCCLLILFAFGKVIKPVVATLFILSAVTSFYMDKLGVIIDREMIQNVVTTTFTEGKHLITLPFVTWVFLWGILPALIAFWVQIKPRTIKKSLVQNGLVFLICLIGFVGFFAMDIKGNSAILRNRGDFKASFQPLAPIFGAVRFISMMTRSSTLAFQEIGIDARLGPVAAAAQQPLLTVIVVGETAREQNFSLGGYARETNPNLSKRDITYFGNLSSCGTATAVSLPCMFSKFDRTDYSYELGQSHENVLDVIGRAGYAVEWIDNNTGDKGLANRLTYTEVMHSQDPKFCGEGECNDGLLVAEVAKRLPDIKENTVLVLHQIGSHGPAYYLRYPQAFEMFKPACRTSEFSKCSADEITNAYDNSIAYTDKVLADMIDLLEAQKAVTTSMIYISDHGESLGEKGLYLHGAPYFLAPEQQTKVPMILWTSKAYDAEFNVDQSCLSRQSVSAFSHDNLFHSLLGMLDVQTDEYKNEQDTFGKCLKGKK